MLLFTCLRLRNWVFVLAFVLSETDSKCTLSSTVICDNLSDAYNVKLDLTLNNVVIKPKERNQNLTQCLDQFLFYEKFENAHSVTVIEQVKGVCHPRFLIETFRPKQLSFSGNHFQNLTPSYFPWVEIEKLSLVNNKIESIGRQTFYFGRFIEIDLSDNQIRSIESGVFNNATKILIIRNNRLLHVEPNSVPPSLVVLDLAYNQLSVLQEGVFDTLANLQQLSLSHNTLFVMPNITNLENLEVLDLAHNNVKDVVSTTSYRKLIHLKMIDFSYNKVENIQFLDSPLCKNGWQDLKIHLGFNMIREVDTEVLKKCTADRKYFWFFGNPLDCDKWAISEAFMQKHGWSQHFCDKRYFSNGVAPYCIGEEDDETFPDVLQQFLDNIRKKVPVITCRR